jgi:hypothetical protein
MDIFTDASHEGISAVLYSCVNVASYPSRIGSDFVLVHNPNALNRVPYGMLKVGTEYWVDGNDLKCQAN